MQNGEFPGDFPDRGIVPPRPEDSGELHPADQEGAGADEHVMFASHDQDTGPAEVVSDNIADLIEAPAEDAPQAEATEAPKSTSRTEGNGSTDGIEIGGYLRRQEVREQSDEFRIAAEAGETGKPREKVAEYYKASTQDLLNHGHNRARRMRDYGEPLTPNIAVMDMVHKLAKDNPDLVEKGRLENDQLRITVIRARAADDVLVINIKHLGEGDGPAEQQWVASLQTGTLYRETSRAKEGDNGYTVSTTREGAMTDQDAARLEEVLGGAKFDALQDKAEDYELAA